MPRDDRSLHVGDGEFECLRELPLQLRFHELAECRVRERAAEIATQAELAKDDEAPPEPRPVERRSDGVHPEPSVGDDLQGRLADGEHAWLHRQAPTEVGEPRDPTTVEVDVELCVIGPA